MLALPFSNEAGSRFGEDFYQPGIVELHVDARDLALVWPNGDHTPLIPTTADHFIDRAYWMPVAIVRDGEGAVGGIRYGDFTGTPVR